MKSQRNLLSPVQSAFWKEKLLLFVELAHLSFSTEFLLFLKLLAPDFSLAWVCDVWGCAHDYWPWLIGHHPLWLTQDKISGMERSDDESHLTALG